jgi:hypothetical protein
MVNPFMDCVDGLRLRAFRNSAPSVVESRGPRLVTERMHFGIETVVRNGPLLPVERSPRNSSQESKES